MKDENLFLGFTVGQWRLFTLVLIVGLALAIFSVMQRQGIQDTAALYIGLPLIIALAFSLTPKTRSIMGATMKGLCIALLLSVPVFGEGWICLLFLSPIFFSVAAFVAWIAEKIKRKVDARSKLRLSTMIVFVAIASFEGTPYELYAFGNTYQVSYTEVVDKDLQAVRGNISNPSFSKTESPLFLNLFPFPVDVSSDGLHIGAEHKIDFVYKKWIFTNEHKGSTVFRVVDSTDTLIRFDIPSDTSYLSNYMTWNSSVVSLEPVAGSSTRITWTLSFTRDLDPAWYFGPMQVYAAWLSAKVLVKNAAS